MNKREKMKAEIKAIIGQSNAFDGLDNGIQFGDILTPNYLDNTPYAEAIKYDVPDGKNDQRVLTSDNKNGIIEATFLAEGAEMPEKKHSFKSKTIKLGKLAILVPTTGEIDQDASYLTAFLRRKLPEAIKNSVNAAIVYGSDGTDAIEGIKGGAATYTTSEIDIVDQVKDMYDNVAPGENLMWVVSKTALDDLIGNAFGIITFEGKEAFMFGIPVVLGNYMEPGEILLGDFSNYAIAQKELKSDVSEHVYFDSDQNLLRTVLRIGGAVTLTAPLSAETYDVSAVEYPLLSGVTFDFDSADLSEVMISVDAIVGDPIIFNYNGTDGFSSSVENVTGQIVSGDLTISDTSWDGTVQSRFIDNGDGTITDENGLMWLKDLQFPATSGFSLSGDIGETGDMSYYTATGYVDEMNTEAVAGYSDWRIPTVDELGLLTKDQWIESDGPFENWYLGGNESQYVRWSSTEHVPGAHKNYSLNRKVSGKDLYDPAYPDVASFASDGATGTATTPRIVQPVRTVSQRPSQVIDTDTATVTVSSPVKTVEVQYPFAMNA